MANYFEAELAESFVALDWFYAKLAVASAAKRKFLRKPPFDYIALSDRVVYGLEAKSNKILGSFPFKRLEPHQYKHLKRVKARGGVAFVLINFRSVAVHATKKAPGITTKRSNTAYAIEIGNWDALIKKLSPRKSIPAEWFNGSVSEIQKIPRISSENGPIWDLNVLSK